MVKATWLKRNIPTYKLGKPEINPVFFEKRVYQGSNGKVYPVPFIDKVYDYKVDKNYQQITLENEYVRLSMLPEIGGRIFEAQDKTNGHYDFFYKQDVIKPALVGLAGPWISGGVEFNWPQHHRPGTFLPSDVYVENEEDGAITVWMSEYDPINRLKGMHGIRLRPGSALIELRARLFNRTPIVQTFLWWANVAVKVHDNYQSFFPADVHYVADHAVRAQSTFPFAENEYYGIPYHQRKGANDLRRYKNIPVPTSYMVCETNYNFFGGYDYKAKGGFIHVANRHISPGKKQWTWGNAEFGKAWDRELTDTGGPYFELMAGVYTDNQPDFSYITPYETKTFSQFWWAYQKLGPVQNANNELAIRLEIVPGNKLDLGVASTIKMSGLNCTLKIGNKVREFNNLDVSPANPWQNNSIVIEPDEENAISFRIRNQEGKELLAYHKSGVSNKRNRPTAFEPKEATDATCSTELNLIGEHLEQYRHPTRYPEPYWGKAIERNPKDYHATISLGKSKLKQGKFAEAEKDFTKAIKILSTYHPNSHTGEAHYYAGLSNFYLDNRETAYTLFYKATWNYEWRSAAYYLLANIDCGNKDWAVALEHIEASLDTNRQNNKACILKAIVQKHLGKVARAEQTLKELLKTDPLDQWAQCELAILTDDFGDFISSSRNDAQTIIDIAFDYSNAGFFEEAVRLIQVHHEHKVADCAVPNPMKRSVMTWFILAWLYDKQNKNDKTISVLQYTTELTPDYFFPSRLNEQIVLNWVIQKKLSVLAAYGLGNYMLDKKRHSDAIKYWELAAKNNMQYGTLYRNLGIAYWNYTDNGEKAKAAFLQAIQYSKEDIRILFEYDQLRKKLNDKPTERLAFIEPFKTKILERDDFCVELCDLYNFTGKYKKALEIMQERNFHPWEGGEGQVIKQYTFTCLKLGEIELEKGNVQAALEYFKKAENTPDNLGEKYHPLQAKAHLWYWQAMAYKMLGETKKAKTCFQKSAAEQGDFVDMAVSAYSELSYFSALALLELGKQKEAEQLFRNIKEYAEEKLKETVKINYFATSLPLLLVFEEDLQKRNTWENLYLIALAELGLKNMDAAKQFLTKVMKLNAMHVGAKNLLFDM